MLHQDLTDGHWTNNVRRNQLLFSDMFVIRDRNLSCATDTVYPTDYMHGFFNVQSDLHCFPFVAV